LSSELIINSSSAGVTIALLKNKKLVELHQDKSNAGFSVGDIYLGTVKKIVPGMNAAFVDVGHEKDGFLHYLDLGPQVRSLNKVVKMVRSSKIDLTDLTNFKLEPEIVKTGKMADVFQRNNQVLVQIVKEPISTKGPRLTTELSLAGRYFVLVPFSDVISVSKKIKSLDERNRLKNLTNSLRPRKFGVIVRTVAEGKTAAELHKDMQGLADKWQQINQQLPVVQPAQKVLGEIDRTSSMLRDLLNSNFQSIHLDDPTLYEEIKAYVKTISPEMEKIVKLYTGKLPIFEHLGIDKQIKGSFGKNVTLQGGAYLVIDHTEALHVIDVNSGSKSNSEINQEENALSVNLEAAGEIARQLRLRDMGGIIVIDFIDLKSAGNKKKVYDKLKDEMATDRAKHKILPMSKFGLVQLTRQRVRPEMNVSTTEVCPMCKGTGESGASILIMDEIEANLDYIITNLNLPKVTLMVHPYIESHIKIGLFNMRMKWYMKYKKWITVLGDASFFFSEYHFLNASGEEITLRP
jgi:ribonuclease G